MNKDKNTDKSKTPKENTAIKNPPPKPIKPNSNGYTRPTRRNDETEITTR